MLIDSLLLFWVPLWVKLVEAKEPLSWLWLKQCVHTGALVFGQVLQKHWGYTREVCGTAGPWPGARGAVVPPVLEPGLGMQLQPRSCGLWRTWPYPGECEYGTPAAMLL